MTAQPPQSFPSRMPDPAAKVLEQAASSEQVGALAELIVQQWKAQEEWARAVLQRLDRMVELAEQNKAALDAMQQGEPDPFSVRGMGGATTEQAIADEPHSPFIGG